MNFNKYLLVVISILLCLSCKPSSVVTDSDVEERQTGGVGTPSLDSISLADIATEKERQLLQYQGSRERKFDLIHTSLDLQFDYDSGFVVGQAILLLKPYFYDQEVLELDAKDYDIHEIWLQEGADRRPLASRYNQRVLSIYLPRHYTALDTLEVGVRYKAKPNENSGMGSSAITDNKGLYFINPHKVAGKPVQIWTQGETEHNSKWFPTIDSPNERATHDFKLTVEDRYITISNGKMESQKHNGDGTRTDHWRMDQPHAPYLAAIVVGEFAAIQDSLGVLPLRYLVEKQYEQGAKEVFKNTPEMIAFFSDLLGVDFPWPKYDQVVVRDFVSGAMENTTVSIFMEELNLDEREAIDSEWDYIIAHELFHQWFGNYVTLESWSNLPLNEAFADYSEYLWTEHKEGKDNADMQHIVALEGYLAEAQEKQEDLIRFYYEDMEDMFDRHSYAKGGRVLHMLRKYLGDEAFFASLNFYLEKHAYSSVEIHDLRLAFEKVTGKDLNWFFNQWFLASGHPVLDIEFDHSQPENVLLTVKQKQDFNTTPLYQIPFKVSWYKGKERRETSFVLNQAVQQFALENGEATDLVLFDESKEILSESQTRFGREHFERQSLLSKAGIARYEALDSLSNNYPFDGDMALLFFEALDDSFSSVRELVLAKIRTNLDSLILPAEVEDRILAIAEEDPDNKVRSGAIELLNRVGPDKFAPLFYRLVNDSSYYVAGAALAAYLENESNNDRDDLAKRLLESTNIQMLVPLADYITNRKDPAMGDWFHSQLVRLNGESLYYFIGYYGDYFARMSELDHDPAIGRLFELAKSHPANYIRLAAFQAMFGFIDEEGVLEKVKELNAGERDEMVRDYQGFFLESYIDED